MLDRKFFRVTISPFDKPTEDDETLKNELDKMGYPVIFSEKRDAPNGLLKRAQKRETILRFGGNYLDIAVELRDKLMSVFDRPVKTVSHLNDNDMDMCIFSPPTEQQATDYLANPLPENAENDPRLRLMQMLGALEW